MLSFLPPPFGPPRSGEPERPSRSPLGFIAAVVLTAFAILLPWLRHPAGAGVDLQTRSTAVGQKGATP